MQFISVIGLVANRAMWSYLVVVSTPTLKLFSGVGHRQEPVRGQGSERAASDCFVSPAALRAVGLICRRGKINMVQSAGRESAVA